MTQDAGHAEPPHGGAWDEPLSKAPLVFLDLEMTGLRVGSDRVIEICACRTRNGQIEAQISSLIKPDCGSHGNSDVHGITPSDLEHAPLFADLAHQIEELIAGSVIVAHAAWWDISFLEAELARIGRPKRIPHFLDTLTLSRRAFAFSNHSLSALCSELKISRSREHRAADDVEALMALWTHLLTVLRPHTPRDLWHIRIGQRHARPGIVAAAVKAAENSSFVNIRYRPARRPPEDYQMRITSVRTDLDPPRVLGYLLPSRSRRDLRSDRILAIEPVFDLENSVGPAAEPGARQK